MYDKDDILKYADPEIIAEFIGIELHRKGSYTFIFCPGHLKTVGREDRTIGNCVLTEHGYHCFSCGASGNVIDLVMDHTGCSFPDALEIIGDACGLSEINPEKRKRQMKMLSATDLSLIGLGNSGNFEKSDNGRWIYDSLSSKPALQEKDRENDRYIRRENEYLLYKPTARISLQSLFEKNPLAYYSLIEQKAKEAADLYKQILNACGSRHSVRAQDIFLLFSENGQLTNENFEGIKKALKNKRRRAENIAEEYERLKEYELNRELAYEGDLFY